MMAIVFLLHHGGEYCAAGWVVCGLLIVASMLRQVRRVRPSASQLSGKFRRGQKVGFFCPHMLFAAVALLSPPHSSRVILPQNPFCSL